MTHAHTCTQTKHGNGVNSIIPLVRNTY